MLVTKVVVLIAAFAVMGASQAARLTQPVAKNVLHYQISVAKSGAQTISAAVGPLSMSETGYSVQRAAVNLKHPGQLGTIPVASYPSGADSLGESEVKKRAVAFFAENYPAIRGGVQAWLGPNGVTQAWVSYTQDVDVKIGFVDTSAFESMITEDSPPPGTPTIETRTISWGAFIGMTGDGAAPSPKVLGDGGARVLYLEYVSLGADRNTPLERYPNGGELSWYTTNATGGGTSGRTVVVTGGAFDLPEMDDLETDPDLMVKCLIDKKRTSLAWAGPNAGSGAIGCPQAFPDAISLMENLGAYLTVLTYKRSIEPVYCSEGDVACRMGEAEPGSGTTYGGSTYFPSLTYSFDVREVLGAGGCTATGYRNSGTYAGKLSEVTSQYMVLPTGEYNLVGQTKNIRLLEPTPFDWTFIIPKDVAHTTALKEYVVNPATGEELVPLWDIPDESLLHLADIEIKDMSPGIQHINSAQFDSQFISLSVTCGPNYNGIVDFGYGVSDASGDLGSNVTSFFEDPKNAGRIYLNPTLASGWTTYPGLTDDCGGRSVAVPDPWPGTGLKCEPSYIVEADASCAAGYELIPAAGTVPRSCNRVAPSLFWIEY
jgi:hypothetical protein